MLKQLQKYFTATTPDPAPTESQEEGAQMVDPQASTDVVATAPVDVTALQVELSAALAQIATLTAEVQAAVEFNAARAAEAQAAKMTARKGALVNAVGTEKADALFSATSALDDAGFNTVLSSFTAAATTEAKSPLFTEAGVEAQAKVPEVGAESNGVMGILTAKYHKQA